LADSAAAVSDVTDRDRGASGDAGARDRRADIFSLNDPAAAGDRRDEVVVVTT
jgi:hypothetical protein